MLVPTVKAKEFEKYGFKKCKGKYGKSECYYLCVATGMKMLFVSNAVFIVLKWDRNDPRIHKRPNCRYRDRRYADDYIYRLIKDGMLKSDIEKEGRNEGDKVIELLENEVKELDERIEKRKGPTFFDETERIKQLDERARGIEIAIKIVKEIYDGKH